MYFKRNGETIHVQGIKSLIKGDKVYVSATYTKEIVPVIVARVRTVECATIVTIKKHPKVDGTHFVGYHTSDKAMSGSDSLLQMFNNSGKRLETAIERAEEVTDSIACRTEALYALKVLRSWLSGSNESLSKDFE
jgi:hypothetical protein